MYRQKSGIAGRRVQFASVFCVIFCANAYLKDTASVAVEIAARTRNTLSRQCDVIVYDKLNGVVHYSSDNVQVYPVDCVYGIIEVKSALSKAELLDALEKIKVLKEMAPRGLAQATGPGFISAYHRPQPFGMVFAYGLAANSLNSLLDNLKEWEAQNPPTVWPNYISVLETGVIEHTARVFERCIGSDQITAISWPHSIPYGEDSLFQFYMALHDACARMRLRFFSSSCTIITTRRCALVALLSPGAEWKVQVPDPKARDKGCS